MKKYVKKHQIMMLLCIIFIVIIGLCIFIYYNKNTPEDIASLTDLWIKEVIVNHNPDAIYNLFRK